jgi:hypothetical protein
MEFLDGREKKRKKEKGWCVLQKLDDLSDKK